MAGDLVVFDFDGTLTRSDTLIPFLSTVDPARTARYAPGAVAAAMRRPEQRDALKERLIGRVLGDRSEHDVRRAGQRFGRRVLPRLLRRDVVAHLEAHRAAGRRLAVASASPGVVVGPAADHLGIDLVVCTGLVAPDGTSPVWRYQDGNCRGPLKLARVEALIERVGPDRLWVYGNLPDDGPILERADVAVTVDRRRLDPLG